MYTDIFNEVCFMTSPDEMEFIDLDEPLNNEELATIIIANNDLLLFNNHYYADCWDYNDNNKFYETTWTGVLHIIIRNTIKSLNDLLINNRQLIHELIDIILN